ncbi:MAG TPA: N-formylglutamate deformylase [Steroidobacteraceae bacterium]|jgi:N-formylglutamate deformylase|nr:N-formylglutamate deformylase [Steroidobacteraceae bacterium]
MMSAAWLEITEGDSPLLLSIPHSGTDIPEHLKPGLVSPFLARCDTDWWVERLYDFGMSLGASVVRTTLSRTVIDVNRDPTGRSLYPGQATTGLCPVTTFDGAALYAPGEEPHDAAIAARIRDYFLPYHAALSAQLSRLKARHGAIVLYDCHAIRSRVPRLFQGELPQFNLGTHNGGSCDPRLRESVARVCAASGHSHVVDGRFKGGYITRHYGRPATHIHALQMELACRGYLHEPEGELHAGNWPAPYDPARANGLRTTLVRALEACLSFAAVQTRA